MSESEWKIEKHHSSSHCASASVKHTLSFTPSYQCALKEDTCWEPAVDTPFTSESGNREDVLRGHIVYVLNVKRLIMNKLLVGGGERERVGRAG